MIELRIIGDLIRRVRLEGHSSLVRVCGASPFFLFFIHSFYLSSPFHSLPSPTFFCFFLPFHSLRFCGVYRVNEVTIQMAISGSFPGLRRIRGTFLGSLRC